MCEELNEAADQTENSYVLPEITQLKEQLLFTWEHFEEQAINGRLVPFKIKQQQQLLDEMTNDAHKTKLLLLALKRAIKAL